MITLTMEKMKMPHQKPNGNPSWKQAERAFAKLFGVKRRPLSGGNEGTGRDDFRHPFLFGECKWGQKFAIWSLFEKTKALAKKEKKIPVLGIKQKGKKGTLIVIHSSDLEAVALEYLYPLETHGCDD